MHWEEDVACRECVRLARQLRCSAHCAPQTGVRARLSICAPPPGRAGACTPPAWCWRASKSTRQTSRSFAVRRWARTRVMHAAGAAQPACWRCHAVMQQALHTHAELAPGTCCRIATESVRCGRTCGCRIPRLAGRASPTPALRLRCAPCSMSDPDPRRPKDLQGPCEFDKGLKTLFPSYRFRCGTAAAAGAPHGAAAGVAGGRLPSWHGWCLVGRPPTGRACCNGAAAPRLAPSVPWALRHT